jgi:hypothetical protein
VVVEVQLDEKEEKRRSWLAYVASLYARLGCPVVLLVVCPKQRTANWSAAPIVFGLPGSVLIPVVLGPRQVPVVTDLDQARRIPQLAVLSALTHGGRADPAPVFQALLAALNTVDRNHATLYTDLVLTALPAEAKARLEEFMAMRPLASFGYPQSDFARRHFSQGEERGKAIGEARGKAIGEVEALLAILDARRVEVPDDIRAEITNCTDLAQLDTWIRRAATAYKIQDLFV